MSMQQYDIFFRRFGIKNPGQLMTPVMTKLDKFEFPKNAIHHFVVMDNIHYGPAGDDYLYRDIIKQIVMEHVVELTEFKGMPKKLSVQTLPYVRQYHMKNRRFRNIPGCANTSRDPNTLIVVNYGFVVKLYRYMKSILSNYNKWWNVQKTVFDTIATICGDSDRQHFIVTDLPTTLPSLQSLMMYSKVMNNRGTQIFDSHESLFLLELWKWLSEEHREESIFAKLTEKDFHKVNIVFQDSGKWILINLGVINSWRYIPVEDEKETEDKAVQKVKIPALGLQKRFLRMMMTLLESKNIVEDVVDQTHHPVEDVTTLTVDGTSAIIHSDKAIETSIKT